MITCILEIPKIFCKCTQTSFLRSLEWINIQKEFFKAGELIKNQLKSWRIMRWNQWKINNSNRRINFLRKQAKWDLLGLYMKKLSLLLIKMEMFRDFKSLHKKVALSFHQLISINLIISEAVFFLNIKILNTKILFLKVVCIKVNYYSQRIKLKEILILNRGKII